MNQIECYLLFVLVFSISIHSKEEREPIEPLCSSPGKTEKRCCVGYRTVAGKCHVCMGAFGLECRNSCPDGYFGLQCLKKCNCTECNSQTGRCLDDTLDNIKDKMDNEPFWKILAVILCGGIILLIVVLITVISYKRKLPPSRPYQQEHITTDTVSMGYASVENNTYLECNHTENTEILNDNLNGNQLEGNKISETGSGHYFSVNPRRKSNADVWKSIKETVEKNRERNNVLQLLTRGNVPQNTNERLSYISVVEEQPPSCNDTLITD